MSNYNQQMVEEYRGNFLKEVEANVEEGDWVKMCMQCGVCSGSCPLGPHWDHPPQELFMMIRANKREEVLESSSMWMCTSCYNCIVRCPRGLPITHIMHGLATMPSGSGWPRKSSRHASLRDLFWNNLTKNGRVNELKLGLSLYFMNGVSEGIKTSLKMKDIGLGMLKTKRMSPMEYFGGHKCKDAKGLQAILAKAQEIEAKKIGQSA